MGRRHRPTTFHTEIRSPHPAPSGKKHGRQLRRRKTQCAYKAKEEEVSDDDRTQVGLNEPDVWVWADSFTNHFFPQSGAAAIEYLQSQGLQVRLIEKEGCCGLPWITSAQLDQARNRIEQAVSVLESYVSSGVPVIGLEPSCLATLRSYAVELSTSEQAKTVANGVLIFAELLTRLVDQGRAELPDLNRLNVVAQPHCHQSSIIGWDADRSLLERAGAEITKVAGCCGLAGNFGVEKGHYETSIAVAESYLMPAIRQQQERREARTAGHSDSVAETPR